MLSAHVTIPHAVDWRQDGAVSTVKNQPTCDSSWAFPSAGALEGQIFRKTKRLISLNDQDLVEDVDGKSRSENSLVSCRALGERRI